MSSKHFFNDPSQLVAASLKSLTRNNPTTALDAENKIVYLANPRNTVSLISGGGSGHEPSFAGFVGHGFLSAAVAGSIFASPSADQVHKCLTKRVNRDEGILVIIMNYTGDKLHFGMAVEKARASGIKAEMVVVGDDVGVGRSKSGRIGRRGLAGTVLVQKIAGALAATGSSLEDVYKVASLTADNVATVGASLSHVHVPGRAPLDDEINTNDEIEIGMGIHNEEGFGRVKTTLPGLVTKMLTQLLDTNDKDRGFISLTSSDQVVVLINNLGGVSNLELGGITEEVYTQLDKTYNITPKRVLAGCYMSSLNGQGFSITLLKLTETGLGAGKSMLELLDAPAETAAWLGGGIQTSSWDASKTEVAETNGDAREEVPPSNLRLDSDTVANVIRGGMDRVIAAEPEVTKYDTLVGDGDCGLCLKTGAEAILKHLTDSKLSQDAVQFVADLSHVVEQNMDGTSGALYAIFLSSLSHSLRQSDLSSPGPVNTQIWANALQGALQSLGKYTPAKSGDRTLVDALQPFVETLVASQDIKQAVEAARKGFESTKGMEASLGRSVYVGGEEWKTCPDPGAYGLYVLLAGMGDRIA